MRSGCPAISAICAAVVNLVGTLGPMPTTSPVIEVNPSATRARVRRLRRYVTENLLVDGDFICPHHAACLASRRPGDAFREGTMSHVGRRYDLRRNGRPLRIVVVGQESGRPQDPALQQRVDLEARYQQVHHRAGLQRHYYTDKDAPGRNTHMRGTTSALRLLVGAGLGSGFDDEFIKPVNGKAFHLFDGFALVNRLLCSAGPPGTSQGRPTRTMFRNCGQHFVATLSILKPTLLIVQGAAVAKGVTQVIPMTAVHGEHLHEARLGEDRMVVCSFSHPSAHGSQRWGDRLDAPYLTEVVAPTLRKALKVL